MKSSCKHEFIGFKTISVYLNVFIIHTFVWEIDFKKKQIKTNSKVENKRLMVFFSSPFIQSSDAHRPPCLETYSHMVQTRSQVFAACLAIIQILSRFATLHLLSSFTFYFYSDSTTLKLNYQRISTKHLILVFFCWLTVLFAGNEPSAMMDESHPLHYNGFLSMGINP